MRLLQWRVSGCGSTRSILPDTARCRLLGLTMQDMFTRGVRMILTHTTSGTRRRTNSATAKTSSDRTSFRHCSSARLRMITDSYPNLQSSVRGSCSWAIVPSEMRLRLMSFSAKTPRGKMPSLTRALCRNVTAMTMMPSTLKSTKNTRSRWITGSCERLCRSMQPRLMRISTRTNRLLRKSKTQ